MKPRIISQIGTNITIVLPFPNHMATEMFNLNCWQQCYDLESISKQILVEAEKYNAQILDIKILWVKYSFYFELYFECSAEFNQFTEVVKKLLAKISK